MKVRLGGKTTKISPGDAVVIQRVEKSIADLIVSGAVDAAVEISPKILSQLQTRVRVAANAEANKIFDVINSIIDEPNSAGTGQLSSTDLMHGVRLSSSIPLPSGQVGWPELSLKYLNWKRKKYATNADRMFRASNAMRNYFARSGRTIVQSRLGGVTVDVDQTVASRRGPHPLVEGRDLEHKLLGRISVTMFPRLTPALAPMLSSRRWTDVAAGGAMEREIFSGTKTADKLAGHNIYRPLVAPTIQFFMLIRIPNVIRKNIANLFTYRGPTDER